jgi:hypothetical protein
VELQYGICFTPPVVTHNFELAPIFFLGNCETVYQISSIYGQAGGWTNTYVFRAFMQAV